MPPIRCDGDAIARRPSALASHALTWLGQRACSDGPIDNIRLMWCVCFVDPMRLPGLLKHVPRKASQTVVEQAASSRIDKTLVETGSHRSAASTPINAITSNQPTSTTPIPLYLGWANT